MNSSYSILGLFAVGSTLAVCNPCGSTGAPGGSVLGGLIPAAYATAASPMPDDERVSAPSMTPMPLARIVTSGRAGAVRTADARTVTLAVKGMTCGGCVFSTRKALTRLPGVTKADVSYAKATAVVTYDPSRVTVAQMVAAIKALGYTATQVAG